MEQQQTHPHVKCTIKSLVFPKYQQTQLHLYKWTVAFVCFAFAMEFAWVADYIVKNQIEIPHTGFKIVLLLGVMIQSIGFVGAIRENWHIFLTYTALNTLWVVTVYVGLLLAPKVYVKLFGKSMLCLFVCTMFGWLVSSVLYGRDLRLVRLYNLRVIDNDKKNIENSSA